MVNSDLFMFSDLFSSCNAVTYHTLSTAMYILLSWSSSHYSYRPKVSLTKISQRGDNLSVSQLDSPLRRFVQIIEGDNLQARFADHLLSFRLHGTFQSHNKRNAKT